MNAKLRAYYKAMNDNFETYHKIMDIKLNCYYVDAGDFNAALVFARNSGRAKVVWAGHIKYDEWININVTRVEDGDKYLRSDAKGEYAEQDVEILRQLGWTYEDEATCNSCGLAPMGMDKYEVCEDCELCLDCGHEDDCPIMVDENQTSEQINEAIFQALSEGPISPYQLVLTVMEHMGCEDPAPVKRQYRILLSNNQIKIDHDMKVISKNQ